MTEHRVRRKRTFFRSSLPKALRRLSSRRSKRSRAFEDFFSSPSPTSITRSSTGKNSVPRRLEDRSSFTTSTTEEYVERFPPSPEQDRELAVEIRRRQGSSVRAKINKYDQLDAKSKMSPFLREVQGSPLSSVSQIYSRVQSFEKIEADSKKVPGPSLEELRKRRKDNAPRSKSCVIAPLYTL